MSADATTLDHANDRDEKLRRNGGAFLAGFRNANTRASYQQQLHRWFAWCDAYGIDPLTVDRVHIELYCRWFEQQVDSINTGSHGLSVLGSFYRWLVHAEVLATTPMAAVRRPRRDDSPKQTRLTRHQLADWLNAAEHQGGAAYATACLLALNGLRVSEVCAIDIEDLAEERWHQVVTIHGKGDKPATVPLAPRSRAAVEQAVASRARGPLLLNRWNNRMARNNVAALMTKLARTVRIESRVTPHTLRHAAITTSLAAGVNPKVVSKRLGHSSVAFTLDTYAHVIPGMQPDAAQMFIDLVYNDEKEARR